MNSETQGAFAPPSRVPTTAIDADTQTRLARLAARRVSPDRPAASGRTTPAIGSRRKRHAAKGSRAAAVMMSVATTAGLSAYFQHLDSAAASATSTNTVASFASAAASSAGAPASSTASASTATTIATGTSDTSSGATTPTTATTAASTLGDGTYTGATATNKWGPVQVEITVTGGQITEVAAIQTPTEDRKSISINARATPTLASEVLTAQNADIDTVSGATYTSDSYKVSLQSAIDLAQATAVQEGATT
jgi:uncharacterized protein with FMN-binding domain